MSDADRGAERDPDADPEADDREAPDAFQTLGDETRLSVLRTLYEHEGPPPTFSTLQGAVGVEVSSRFAYHLRQLTGRYVRKVPRGDPSSDHADATPGGADADGDGRAGEEGYALTYAGRKVARAVAAGTYTDSVDLDPIDLDDPCPHCGAEDLVARCADNVVGVACEACERPVLSLPLPPQGYRDRDRETIPEAFDRHHRHRLALLRAGVCPECSGVVEGRIERLRADAGDRSRMDDEGDRPAGTDGDGEPSDGTAPAGRVRAAFECTACGYAIRTPVTLTLLTHPAVAAFYSDHGVDVRDRPIWNAGDEWREAVISEDPAVVAVSTVLDEELLELYLDGRANVVDHRRTRVEDG